jgi:phospholipase/carboxylesterase
MPSLVCLVSRPTTSAPPLSGRAPGKNWARQCEDNAMVTPLCIDSQAVLWSAPPQETTHRPLLVLLHGLGSHEGDVFGLSPFLPLEPVVAAIRAPLASSPGYSWFPISETMTIEPRDVDAAARAVLEWLDELGPLQSLGLLGFSQGAVTALQVQRHAHDRINYVVNLAGFVAPGNNAGDRDLSELRPPVFWGRGTHDSVIPRAAIAHTEKWLPEHSSLDARVYEGLGHGISERELADVDAFIRANSHRDA